MSQLQSLDLAGFGARLGAFALDLAIVAAICFLLTLALQGQREPGVGQGLEALNLKIGTLTGFLVFVSYFSLATWLGQGRTPGKWLCGIRVVSLYHDQISLWHCVERALGYSASSLEAGLGFLQYFTHPNRQTVHDRIAETLVIVAKD